MTALGFVLGTLAVWRLAHLLTQEDGPARALARLRERLAPGGFWATLLGCFQCASLWAAIPMGWWLGDGWGQRIVAWLALSGAACLLQRAAPDRAPQQALFYEGDAQDTHHELLRRSTPGDRPPPTP